MKREGLRRRLALATVEILRQQKITVANIKRYVIPHLHLYCVCKKERITETDIRVAIFAVNQSLIANAPSFRYGVGEDFVRERETYFLTNPIFSQRF